MRKQKRKISLLSALAVMVLSGSLLQVTHAQDTAILSHEFVYETAPFPQCHAATIVQSKAGTLLTAWFGGTKERHPDVGIWVSRLENAKWSTPVEVANGVQSEGQRLPTWNPVLFQPSNGPLTLYFKVGPSPDHWWGEVMTSDDDGRTWKDRQKLPDNGIGPVKDKPVELADGTIVCPSSDESNGWTVHIESTKDNGKTWSKVGPLNDGKKIRAIQPTMIKLGGNKLAMLCRDGNSDGNIWQTMSEDNGATWTSFQSAGLPNPNSGIDAVTLADGRHVLVYNHTIRSGESPRGREHLGIAISRDGKKWQAALTLEQSKGEYSYPAIIQSKDGLVHVAYTWNRRKIRHVVIDPNKLKAVDYVDGKWPESSVPRLASADSQ